MLRREWGLLQRSGVGWRPDLGAVCAVWGRVAARCRVKDP